MPKSKKRNPSSTKGRDKTSSCKKSALKNMLVHDHRSWKTKPMEYAKACIETDKQKGNLKSHTTIRFEETLT